VCDGLIGNVVEVGFGSGLNVPFYPSTVTAVAAVEPSDTAWKLADKRLRATHVPVRRSALDAQTLPYTDDSFDAAVSSWSLCTIPDAVAALQEIRRVLKPGARLHFAEHGLAPDEAVRRWQRRLEPVQRRIFAGCHLTRRIDDLLTCTGFIIEELDAFYETRLSHFSRVRNTGLLNQKTERETFGTLN
jgi:ubiquinone/menaquinone biosynthesis C-methylase UbiE